MNDIYDGAISFSKDLGEACTAECRLKEDTISYISGQSRAAS